jgi:hypothetical protein
MKIITSIPHTSLSLSFFENYFSCAAVREGLWDEKKKLPSFDFKQSPLGSALDFFSWRPRRQKMSQILICSHQRAAEVGESVFLAPLHKSSIF